MKPSLNTPQPMAKVISSNSQPSSKDPSPRNTTLPAAHHPQINPKSHQGQSKASMKDSLAPSIRGNKQSAEPAKILLEELTRDSPIQPHLLPPEDDVYEIQTHTCQHALYNIYPKCGPCHQPTRGLPCSFRDFRAFGFSSDGNVRYGPYFVWDDMTTPTTPLLAKNNNVNLQEEPVAYLEPGLAVDLFVDIDNEGVDFHEMEVDDDGALPLSGSPTLSSEGQPRTDIHECKQRQKTPSPIARPAFNYTSSNNPCGAARSPLANSKNFVQESNEKSAVPTTPKQGLTFLEAAKNREFHCIQKSDSLPLSAPLPKSLLGVSNSARAETTSSSKTSPGASQELQFAILLREESPEPPLQKKPRMQETQPKVVTPVAKSSKDTPELFCTPEVTPRSPGTPRESQMSQLSQLSVSSSIFDVTPKLNRAALSKEQSKSLNMSTMSPQLKLIFKNVKSVKESVEMMSDAGVENQSTLNSIQAELKEIQTSQTNYFSELDRLSLGSKAHQNALIDSREVVDQIDMKVDKIDRKVDKIAQHSGQMVAGEQSYEQHESIRSLTNHEGELKESLRRVEVSTFDLRSRFDEMESTPRRPAIAYPGLEEVGLSEDFLASFAWNKTPNVEGLSGNEIGDSLKEETVATSSFVPALDGDGQFFASESATSATGESDMLASISQYHSQSQSRAPASPTISRSSDLYCPKHEEDEEDGFWATDSNSRGFTITLSDDDSTPSCRASPNTHLPNSAVAVLSPLTIASEYLEDLFMPEVMERFPWNRPNAFSTLDPDGPALQTTSKAMSSLDPEGPILLRKESVVSDSSDSRPKPSAERLPGIKGSTVFATPVSMHGGSELKGKKREFVEEEEEESEEREDGEGRRNTLFKRPKMFASRLFSFFRKPSL
ncbi:hypothetical protein HDU97_006928 [Phlyctochytrium planicorne]|nr:hypothetical protein HDU97_006928 [Phlyctochytrium planicorne]